ncbi:conjugal transfer protein [Bacteroidia bacterium]|nr:conjugal transfer protein [Bacteroidia bacterium]
MKKIKNFLGITAWLVAMMLLALACSDDLDIHTRYLFDLETMPVPKKIVQGETAEIRCQLVKEGNYQDTKFYIRYFQPDGVGELRMDDGRVLAPNDLFPLTNDVFRLYYTSRCTDQQVIDVYVQDSFGQVIQKTFSFQNEGTEDKEE